MNEEQNEIHQNNVGQIISNWGLIKRTIRVIDVINPLIEAGVIDPGRWITLKKNSQLVEEEKVEEILHILIREKQNPKDICVFYDALKTAFPHTASYLKIQKVTNDGK